MKFMILIQHEIPYINTHEIYYEVLSDTQKNIFLANLK